MNRIEDERIRFYLEHQARIREWAGLEAEVRKFADRFYCSLKDDLAAALGSGQVADNNVQVFLHDKGPVYRDYRGLGLRRHNWPGGDEDPDVRLEWHRKWVCFSDEDHLVCGVRTNVEHCRQPFTKERRPNHPEQNAWWPALAKVGPPVGRFWESDNLKEHRDSLVETIVKAWKDLAPLVDEAVGRPAPLTDVDEAGGPRGGGRS